MKFTNLTVVNGDYYIDGRKLEPREVIELFRSSSEYYQQQHQVVLAAVEGLVMMIKEASSLQELQDTFAGCVDDDISAIKARQMFTVINGQATDPVADSQTPDLAESTGSADSDAPKVKTSIPKKHHRGRLMRPNVKPT